MADKQIVVLTLFIGFGAITVLLTWRCSPLWLQHFLPFESDEMKSLEGIPQQLQSLAGRQAFAELYVRALSRSDILACAVGGARNRALILLDEQFLKALSTEEVNAILAHELGHIALGHTARLTLLQAALFPVLLIPAIVVTILYSLITWQFDCFSRNFRTAFIVLPYLIFPLTSLLVLVLMRRWEYAADRYAVKLVGKPAVLATLRCLHGVVMPDSSWTQVTAFRQERLHWLLSRLSTHPSIPQRITALWRC